MTFGDKILWAFRSFMVEGAAKSAHWNNTEIARVLDVQLTEQSL